MRKRFGIIAIALAFAAVLAFAGCSSGTVPSASSDTGSNAPSAESSSAASRAAEPALAAGEYVVEFNTDSSMFHVNEANDGKGVLTVSDEGMTVHVSLVSKKIVNLFLGTAEDASHDGAEILEPTADMVTYGDGYQEEVYGFDIPVPVLDEEFDVAILGEKGKWYDHKVSVSNPVAE